ncbi:hypothetical protein BDW72DRAFT_52532 [Aspergillus terricola var. indicus]
MIPQQSVPSVFCLVYFASLYLYPSELLLFVPLHRTTKSDAGSRLCCPLTSPNLSHPT